MASVEYNEQQVMKRIQEYPPGIVAGLTLVQANAAMGRPWAFIHKDVDLFLEEFGSSISTSGVFKTFRINETSLLVQADSKKLATLFRDLGVRGFFDEKDIQEAFALEMEAIKSMAKYLKKTVSMGQRSPVVGIYNLNDSNTITINGITLPAFGVSLAGMSEAVKLAGLPQPSLSVYDFGKHFGLPNKTPSRYMVAPSGNALLVHLNF